MQAESFRRTDLTMLQYQRLQDIAQELGSTTEQAWDEAASSADVATTAAVQYAASLKVVTTTVEAETDRREKLREKLAAALKKESDAREELARALKAESEAREERARALMGDLREERGELSALNEDWRERLKLISLAEAATGGATGRGGIETILPGAPGVGRGRAPWAMPDFEASTLAAMSTTEQISEGFFSATSATQAFDISIGALSQTMASFAAGSLDLVLGKSVQYVHANREQARAAKAMELSTSEAYRALAREVIKAAASAAAVESILEFGRGLAALARSFFDLTGASAVAAGGHFAAAAVLASIAGAAAVATSRIGPVRKTIPDTGPPGAPPVGPSPFDTSRTPAVEGRAINVTVIADPRYPASPDDYANAVRRAIQEAARDRDTSPTGFLES